MIMIIYNILNHKLNFMSKKEEVYYLLKYLSFIFLLFLDFIA